MADIKRRIVEELHKPARIHFSRRKTVVKGIRDLYQGDLADFSQYASVNKNYTFILLVIDCMSKRVFGEPLKNKSAPVVAAALRKIFIRAKPPRLFQTDNGLEFYNSAVRGVLDEFKVKHYSTYSTTHSAIIERFIRTFKSHLYKEFSYNGNYKWLDLWQKIIDKYHASVHRTLGMRPADVNAGNEKLLLRSVFNYSGRKNRFRATLAVNDHVRLTRARHVFTKSYLPNFTTEIFRVRKVQRTVPHSYLLEDMAGRPILGTFYAPELQKTTLIDDYLVEKVIRRRGDMLYVKWLGFDHTHNSWISKKDVL
jgi:transposase InsO family protein